MQCKAYVSISIWNATKKITFYGVPEERFEGFYEVYITADDGINEVTEKIDMQIREKIFIRGDTNNDGEVDLSDPIFLLALLFGNGEPLLFSDSGDVNDDGAIDIADSIYLLSYLFANGPEPKPPFPYPGRDPSPDKLI